MPLVFTLVNWSLRFILRRLCKVDDTQLRQVPDHGPLILVANHINFLDVPVLATHLLPRPLTAFAKSETWDNPFLGLLFSMWGAIPLHRGEADINAFRLAEKALAGGKILAIAPEGTRSGDGILQRGYPGVVHLAKRTGAPLLPVVYYGNERFHANIRKLRRTDFNIKVGQPFYLNVSSNMNAEERQAAADEVMYQLALLLPERYRGYYADVTHATNHYIIYKTPACSAPLFPSGQLQPAG
ncbi:MAG: lysophospholipid acyltransferase family protein [Anaerolineae bacterium]